MPAVEAWTEAFAETISIYTHLKSVVDNVPLRNAYREALPLLSAYETALEQHRDLYELLQKLQQSKSPRNAEQDYALTRQIRHYRLYGVTLNIDKRRKFTQLQQNLSEYRNGFQEHLQDATQDYAQPLHNTEECAGLPQSICQLLQQNARNRNLSSPTVTLDAPTFRALMRYADHRPLRARLHRAYLTRASRLSDHTDWDNSTLMLKILRTREAIAHLTGFTNAAEYLLYDKMVQNPAEVIAFLEKLATTVQPYAQREYDELETFAREECALERMQPWDQAWVSEKLRRRYFTLDEEQLRAYFPLEHVLETTFTLIGQWFEISFEPVKDFSRWHDDVRLFKLKRNGETLAALYTDFYARANKHGGAWMDFPFTRRRINHKLQWPVAYLICNFRPPLNSAPALLSHEEVTTLYHELGHCLHHLLTQVETASVSGIRGTPLDGVEVPSQFLEGFARNRQVLQRLSRHYQHGYPLPDEDIDQLIAGEHFGAGLSLLTQIRYALIDAQLHLEIDQLHRIEDLYARWQQIQQRYSPVPIVEYDRFLNGFGHIFSGGYAMGYYSYLWSEVMAADAFDYLITDAGINPHRIAAFHNEILQRGGSADFAHLYRNFRGQDAALEPLLRQHGLQEIENNNVK